MLSRRCLIPCVLSAVSLLTAGTSVGQIESHAPVASRQELILLLSEAQRSFDRGTTLLKTAPDEALAAFRNARDKFQGVADSGIENGPLFYNLGNTHLRLGAIGHAIADYRRAQRLIPHDQQLQANLRFARSLTRDRIESGGKRALLHTVFFWHYEFPLRMRSAAAMTAYAMFWVLLIVRLMSPRAGLAYLVAALLAVWMGLAVSVTVDLAARGQPTEGVLVANDVVIRRGNGEGYDPQFEHPLHEGVEFKLLERRGGWMLIELPDANTGWVRQREVELF